jgi:hypothetical protein
MTVSTSHHKGGVPVRKNCPFGNSKKPAVVQQHSIYARHQKEGFFHLSVKLKETWFNYLTVQRNNILQKMKPRLQ